MADEYDNVESLSTNEQFASVVVDGQIFESDTGTLPEVIVTAEIEQTGSPFFGEAWETNYVSRPTQVIQVKYDNPLLDYTTVNYNLSLHLLSHATLDSILANPNTSYVPENVIVASAGRYQELRNTNFREDFYFEDFRMETYINIGQRNRNSNLIECKFTIIEPLGFTFINRLIAAVQGIGESNYIEQPFMLQIDFFAGTDTGTTIAVPLTDHKKYIPIRFTEIKSRITNKGTEYQISAVPYNHHALSYIHVVSPANFRIRADTVQDAFGNGQLATQEITTLIEANQREKEIAELTNAVAQNGINRSAKEYYLSRLNELKAASVSDKSYIETGYTNALNTWNAELVKANQKIKVNTYNVIFEGEIGNSKLFSATDKIVTTQSVTEKGGDSTANKSDIGLNASTLSWTGGVLNIPKGTKLDELINFIVRSSEYVTGNVYDPLDSNAVKNNAEPFKWFRIIPSMTKTGYDPSTQTSTYNITYRVRPWTVNSKHPFVSNGKAQGYVKEYDYIFTGKNRDVLDLQIDFDMLYYTQLQSMRYQDSLAVKSLTSQNTNQAKVKGVAEGVIPTQPTPVIPCQDTVMKVPIYYTSEDNSLQTAPSTSSVKQATAADVQRSLTTSSRGDMINVKLKILGDPQLIKQDDLFYGQSLDSGQTNSILTPNNSIFTDDGELYVKLNIKTPVDYDDTLGLAAVGPYDYSAFSGIYKIITIDNSFNKGRFEQTLDLVRIVSAEYCPTYAVSASEAYTSALLGQLPTTSTSTRFAGPAILVNNLASGGSLSLSGFGAQLQALALGKIQSEVQKAVSGLVDGLVTGVSDSFLVDNTGLSNYGLGLDAITEDNNYGFGDLSDIATGVPDFDTGSFFEGVGDDFFI